MQRKIENGDIEIRFGMNLGNRYGKTFGQEVSKFTLNKMEWKSVINKKLPLTNTCDVVRLIRIRL